MSASKRPSTSSLRRFITSRPYVPVAELRRRFGLEEPDDMAHLRHNGTSAWIGLPERETAKLQDLWDRGELGVELSVEVRAPVVVGVYPMRIARYAMDNGHGANGHGTNGNGPISHGTHGQDANGQGTQGLNGRPADNAAARPDATATPRPRRVPDPHTPRPMAGAPSYGQPRTGIDEAELPRAD